MSSLSESTLERLRSKVANCFQNDPNYTNIVMTWKCKSCKHRNPLNNSWCLACNVLGNPQSTCCKTCQRWYPKNLKPDCIYCFYRLFPKDFVPSDALTKTNINKVSYIAESDNMNFL